MSCYQIADISLGVLWGNEHIKNKKYRYHDCIVLPRILEAFRCNEKHQKLDMNVKVNEIREFSFNKNYKKIFNQSFFQQDDKMVMTVYDPYDEAMPGYSIVMSSDYSYVEYTPHIKEYEHYDLQWLMHPFEGKVLYKGGIVLHGAAIEHNGKGIIFTGISGSGKTTCLLYNKITESCKSKFLKVASGNSIVLQKIHCRH